MKSTSHFAVGHLLFNALEERNVFLNKTAFLYGNIAPDYIPHMVLTPHFGKVCTRNAEEIARELARSHLPESRIAGAEYSKMLGMMCHYLCDYFCFAHNKEFTGSLRQHPAYENELDLHLRKNWRSLIELDPCAELAASRSCVMAMRALEAEKATYSAAGFSFDNDLRYAFTACCGMIMAVVAMSLNSYASSGPAFDDFPFSLKGFATGNCYVFRMFLYKNRKNNIFFIPELMSPLTA